MGVGVCVGGWVGGWVVGSLCLLLSCALSADPRSSASTRSSCTSRPGKGSCRRCCSCWVGGRTCQRLSVTARRVLLCPIFLAGAHRPPLVFSPFAVFVLSRVPSPSASSFSASAEKRFPGRVLLWKYSLGVPRFLFFFFCTGLTCSTWDLCCRMQALSCGMRDLVP